MTSAMAKASAHSTYARIVGEVAIAWNGLERRLESLIYHYLTVDAHVAGFILGEMRNVTKAEFAKFLIERFETHELLKDHGLHFVALVNRVRENRNILEHAQPLSFSERYHGKIYKLNKRGFEIPFDAPIGQLKALLKTMQDAAPYARWLMFCLGMYEDNEADGFQGGPTTAEAALQVLASIERPQLPMLLAPLS
jgi:hypothetical protein